MKIASLCGDVAYQIFQGARLEGVSSIGLCQEEELKTYQEFPQAKPDKFLIISSPDDLLKPKVQRQIQGKEAVFVPHSTLLDLLKVKNLIKKFKGQLFGNRKTLEVVSNPTLGEQWIENAGVNYLKKRSLGDVKGKCLVTFSSTIGGEGFLYVQNEKELQTKLNELIRRGLLNESDRDKIKVQEYDIGYQINTQFFYSPFTEELELLDVSHPSTTYDDHLFRSITSSSDLRSLKVIPSSIHVGNRSLIIGGEILKSYFHLGRQLIETASDMFPPGIIGPFQLKTVFTSKMEVKIMDIIPCMSLTSNLSGWSPYSSLYYKEFMSLGRRIARELKYAQTTSSIPEVTT